MDCRHGLLTIAVAVGACGRLDFDDHPPGDARDALTDDGGGDGPGSDACVPSAGSYQLVANGGFESGALSPWTEDMPNNGTPTVVATAQAGSFGLQLTPDVSGIAGYSISQVVSVTGGTPYVLSAYLDASALVGAEGIYLDNNDAIFEVNVASVAGQPGWQFVYGTFQTPTFLNAASIRIVHDGTIAPARSAWADDVAVTEQAQFVAPVFCP